MFFKTLKGGDERRAKSGHSPQAHLQTQLHDGLGDSYCFGLKRIKKRRLVHPFAQVDDERGGG